MADDPREGPSEEAPRCVRGYVEAFDGRVLSGWASDGTATPVRLEVDVEGDLYCEILADEPRQDVIEAGAAVAASGFRIEIPRAFFTDAACRIDVRAARTGEPLVDSPFVIERRDAPAAPERPALADLDATVEAVTEATTSIPGLQADVARIMGWLQRSVDRANALRRADALRYDAFNRAVAATGGLGGSVGHLYGILQQTYPQIVFEGEAAPRVTIVVPVRDKFALTYECLRSIHAARTLAAFEVVIVDDESSDETLLAPLVFLGRCTTVRCPRNEGFVGACNRGAARARGEFVLFLNNDTLVADGWLDALVATLDRDPTIGIAGSRLLFADGVLQEAGGIVWRDGSAWNWGRGQDRMHPAYSFLREADYVSGAALLIRRALFEGLGGFDAHFAPAYYEDTDLCFRARAAGHRVVVQPASTIVHLEGQSNGTDTGAGLKRYQIVNAKKFRDRWADVLATHSRNGEEPVREAERAAGPRALFIDETTPTPDQDAGSNAAFEHMLSLQRLGYKVVFLPADNMAHIPGYTEALQARGIECWYAPFAWSVEEYFRRNDRRFALVYVHRKANIDRYLHLVRKYVPAAHILFNYADIHALRDLREARLGLADDAAIRAHERAFATEVDFAERVDAVIVHSTFERDFIRERVPDARVHCVPWTFPARDGLPRVEVREGIVFVGGFGHRPNVDAVDWFAAEIWPPLRERGASFRVVGSHMPARFADLRAEGIDPIGFVADLDALLDRTRVTVAPLRYGAGLKGKVLTSFARGVPCVMTGAAAEGMELTEELAALVTDDPRRFAQLVALLLVDDPAWRALAAASLRFVRERYAPERIDALLAEAVRPAPRRG